MLQKRPKSKKAERDAGIYRKYRVQRLGDTEKKHARCEYYVLDWMHDRFAVPAARAYADACAADFPALAADLRARADRAADHWATVATVPGYTRIKAEDTSTTYPKRSGS